MGQGPLLRLFFRIFTQVKAPALISIFAMSVQLIFYAMWSGVRPKKSWEFGFAPCYRSLWTMSDIPHLTAQCKAVSLFYMSESYYVNVFR